MIGSERPLDVRSGRSIFHYLREILATVPQRMRKSFWRVDEYLYPGSECEFFAVPEELEETLAVRMRERSRFDFAQLEALAGEEGQIIWASFWGYDSREAGEPWICMSAVDSSFWRFDTDDAETRKWVRATFQYVSEGPR